MTGTDEESSLGTQRFNSGKKTTQKSKKQPKPLSVIAKENPNLKLDSTAYSPRHISTDFENGNNEGKTHEALDYLNQGQPHVAFSPLMASFDNEKTNGNLLTSKSTHSQSFNSLAGQSVQTVRKSLEFTKPDPTVSESHGNTHQTSSEDCEKNNRDSRGLSIMTKLKAFTSTTSAQAHKRSISISISGDEHTSTTQRSPAFSRLTKPSQAPRHEDSDIEADADAEETADEDVVPEAARSRKKIRFRRPRYDRGESNTAPPTPGINATGDAELSSGGFRIVPFFNRRATDGIIDQRGHFSEGEGDYRVNHHRAWRRGSNWIVSGRGHCSYGGHESHHGEGASSSRRPHNFKRSITGLGGGLSDGEATTPKRPFFGADRATSFGAQRWRMIRQGLKMFGQKKEEHKVDYLKSAELMAELRAGAPAALMLASMVQRDEHGNKRIPVLLEQVKLQVMDSKSSVEESSDSERHLVFRIELEYGSGLNRMRWVIHRSLRDFANLHIRYKLQGSSDKYIQLRSDIDSRPKQPRFPKSAFPFFRGVRGLGDSDEEETEPVQAESALGDGTHSENDHITKKKGRSMHSNPRRKSSAILFDSSGTVHGVQQMKVYNEKQRRRLEHYLQEMIRWLIFRADSNRLCRFLELSALGVRLAAEGSYHGKEGYLVIQSTKALNSRRLLYRGKVLSRCTPKWFLVRHSYIVCVDSPENIHILDVFLVDSKFEVLQKRRKLADLKANMVICQAENATTHPQNHCLRILNSERKLKLLAKNERQLRQFEDSIDQMLRTTNWSKPNRFDSFAPVRTGIFAQWLVDGRDYMWNVSRAINMAKDVIYIHDWWLSPQLYLRRPAAISQKWRLDRLLQRKAREGVKIFIIIYRNVEAAIPIDSEFTKSSMLDLHQNIFVQRSPNQFKKNQFFYAHHEKICIVDHTVAFVGGIDLCFGRWDTPQHSVVDDKPTGFEQSELPKDADHCQMWPGKDYSNPRVQDFFQLNEPYAEMYDRSKTPRMPWHDISMQIVGQPARDLTRHFVQRWNYVLRGRKPTRPTPYLLPPPDYDPADLKDLGLTGTCEVQILRSASDWSLGLTETEHSIMTAYCKMIEESEHFVYMENQFFISSCETMNVKIVNKVGDAIVERALRAHQNNESWRCIILIPLMPGFQNTVDEPEGSSVRLIMQCQFRSICRGEGSIFGKLRSYGIYPQDFVQFYSLRSWGRIGPKKVLVTEQLYIHAKAIIADDRVALIGSANINERSMLGARDSECAAIVRDTDMLWSTMDGQPYLVGRFAHTLRVRLMREHLGLDVDNVMEEERREEERRAELHRGETTHSHPEIIDNEKCGANKEDSLKKSQNQTNGSYSKNSGRENEMKTTSKQENGIQKENGKKFGQKEFNAETGQIPRTHPSDVKIQDNLEKSRNIHQGASRVHDFETEKKTSCDLKVTPQASFSRHDIAKSGSSNFSQLPSLPATDDIDIGGSPLNFNPSHQQTLENFNPLTADIKPAIVSKDCMRDPLDERFFKDTWCRIAKNNTKIFRRVFRCNPDSEVQAWSDYRQFVAYGARFVKEQFGEAKTSETETNNSQGKNGPSVVPLVGLGVSGGREGVGNISEKTAPIAQTQQRSTGNSEELNEKEMKDNSNRSDRQNLNGHMNGISQTLPVMSTDDVTSIPTHQSGIEAFPPLENSGEELTRENEKSPRSPTPKMTPMPTAPDRNFISSNGTNRRRRRTTKGSRKTFSASDDLLSIADCEELLSLVQGNLVSFPYDWLVKEELNSNWLYQVDQVAPLQIYD
ncbi:Phospholipase D1 [Golovinomyces cichoracearum]|uniref:Phospholipase n=1 Tax=Golovinomyces cichoracearum TaxID=62708 RepID=A0A420IGR4_9PEZI|nr:Phospholipase D1 [Golovinomyces cichoracearum]